MLPPRCRGCIFPSRGPQPHSGCISPPGLPVTARPRRSWSGRRDTLSYTGAPPGDGFSSRSCLEEGPPWSLPPQQPRRASIGVNFIPGRFSQAHPALPVAEQGKALSVALGLLRQQQGPRLCWGLNPWPLSPAAPPQRCAKPGNPSSLRLDSQNCLLPGGGRSLCACQRQLERFQALSSRAINLMGTHLGAS